MEAPAFVIEVPMLQPGDFAHPQAQPVHQGKHHPVGCPPVDHVPAVLQCGRTGKQAFDLGGFEEAGIGCPPDRRNWALTGEEDITSCTTSQRNSLCTTLSR